MYFILWPFGALVNSIKNFRNPGSKTLFWLFCIYFGFVFIFANPTLKGGADSARYAKQLISLHNNPVSWDQLVVMFYNSEDGYTDVYQPLVTWITSFFTDDPRWLFALFAFVFGYFYVQNLWIILSKTETKVGLVLFLFILAFALVNPIWNINGVRMYTAAQVFLFGALQYFMLNNKKGLLWCAASILIHFSFMFPVGLFLLYLLIPKSAHILFIFYFVTSFIKEINLVEIRNFLSFLPGVFQPKILAYTNEMYHETVQKQMANMAWHVIFARKAENWILYSWVILIYFNFKDWLKNLPEIKNLFLFALFLGGWAQIASLVPSGVRFISVSHSLLYAVIILLIIQSNIKQQFVLSKISVLPLLFVIIFQIRVGLDYVGILTFAGNPFIAFFYEDQTPLIEFVKSIF